MADYPLPSVNIEEALLAYFTDPHGFRTLQATTGMVISGSFALWFLSSASYQPADLDLYVCRDQYALCSQWLEGNGYQLARLVTISRDGTDVREGEATEYPSAYRGSL